MSITADLLRGHTETIILAHLYAHESYGYEINKAILEKSGGKFELKEATIYGAFRRLEEAGMIASYWGNEETGGARRRYYVITDKGREAYRGNIAEWNEAKEIIEKLVKIAGGKNER